MINQITFSEESIQKLKQSGLDVKSSIEASYGKGLVEGKVSASVDVSSSSDSQSSMGSSDKEVKMFVFGGEPPKKVERNDAIVVRS